MQMPMHIYVYVCACIDACTYVCGNIYISTRLVSREQGRGLNARKNAFRFWQCVHVGWSSSVFGKLGPGVSDVDNSGFGQTMATSMNGLKRKIKNDRLSQKKSGQFHC